MREVDPGIEHAASGILAFRHHVAAQHCDFALRIEDADIGADLGRDLRVIVFRVQEALVRQQQHRRLAVPFDPCAAEIERAVAQELGQRLGRFLAGQQHGMAKVQARFRIGEQLVAQDALVDLAAFLFRLAQLGLGGHFGAARRQARHQLGGVIDQPLQPHELAPGIGQSVVEGAGVAAQEDEAGVACGLLDDLGNLGRRLVALWLGRQSAQPLVDLSPVVGEQRRVGRKVAGCRLGHGDERIHLRRFLPEKIVGAGDGI